MRQKPSHCVNGHEFTPENTCIPPGTTKWTCRACNIARQQRSRQKAKTTRSAELDRLVAVEVAAIDLAWATGLFEGEGTVTISTGGQSGYARGVIIITNTDTQVLQFFQSRWGGTIRPMSKTSNRARQAYSWRMNSGRRVVQFIKQLLPYVQTTRVRTKMELILEFELFRAQAAYRPDYKIKSVEFLERMRELNHRGE